MSFILPPGSRRSGIPSPAIWPLLRSLTDRFGNVEVVLPFRTGIAWACELHALALVPLQATALVAVKLLAAERAAPIVIGDRMGLELASYGIAFSTYSSPSRSA